MEVVLSNLSLLGVYLGVMVFILGACVGSFANVCILRIPAEQSVVRPRSRCLVCGRMIAWYDNIPLLSFLVLRRKCRHCAATISWQYPVVELLTALLFLALWLQFGFDARTPVYWAMATALVIGSAIDLEHYIIPDRITIGGMLAGPVLSALVPSLHACPTPYQGFSASLIGLACGALSLWLVAAVGSAIFRKEAMGMGDVKLMGAVGALLGWRAVLFTIMAASIFGALIGMALVLARRKKMAGRIPFGPFIAAAALLWIFRGAQWTDCYLDWLMRGTLAP